MGDEADPSPWFGWFRLLVGNWVFRRGRSLTYDLIWIGYLVRYM